MTTEPRYILAPFVPTPADVVDRMLALAAVNSDDVVYDLGCGDGRIIVAAAKKFGAQGLGVDIENHWVNIARANATEAGVDHLATFTVQDAMTLDLAPATVVMMYLVGWSTRKFQPLIKSMMKPGTRVVSHSFDMHDWPPAKIEEFCDTNGDRHTLYLWIAE